LINGIGRKGEWRKEQESRALEYKNFRTIWIEAVLDYLGLVVFLKDKS